MTFDVYFPFEKEVEGVKRWVPGVAAKPKTWQEIVELMNSPRVVSIVKDCHRGMKERKGELPAICFVGRSVTGKRAARNMEPTQFIMLDVDHVENPREAWASIKPKIEAEEKAGTMALGFAHVTPSGHGLRLVFRAVRDESSIIEQMAYISQALDLGSFGDDDEHVKDLSRLSFMPMSDDILAVDTGIMSGETTFELNPIENNAFDPDAKPEKEKGAAPKPRTQTAAEKMQDVVFSEEEIESFDKADFRGTPLKVVIEKYVETFGPPGAGEVHNFYNDLVKNFRCICDNNKRLLLYALPRFGHSQEECWSQIVSICRVNTLSTLPKHFYFFLKDNGFWKPRGVRVTDLQSYMMSDEPVIDSSLPYLPPVFRELVGICPPDFVVPAVNALLPIIGTLTSYVRAVYPYDNKVHSTSFFSVIYAPAGTGKSFVEQFMDLLFKDLKLRDYVSSARENVYLRAVNRKSDNEKSPDMPHISLRIIPAKNSEPEFLQKQQDNHGYHMFTYAAEMDSWAKGVRAAGGNKDDMIRVAWDNGEYGQQFKSANTFKGMVRLYWNVLITGTLPQLENYFKNVENGLVSRCSFCSIENQEFAPPPVWRSLNKRAQEVIRKFVARCDERTYESPCTVSIPEVDVVSDEDFDKEIDWRFKFRGFQTIDMSWLKPTIDKFHKEQIKKGALDVDRARDVFRRRVAVRGFRLGMICYCLWEKPRVSDLLKCIPFIEWWMEKDIENILKLWGARYNEQADYAPVIAQRTVFNALGNDFTRADVYAVCVKQGIKSPVRRIIYDWNKLGCIEKLSKDNFRKKKDYVSK